MSSLVISWTRLGSRLFRLVLHQFTRWYLGLVAETGVLVTATQFTSSFVQRQMTDLGFPALTKEYKRCVGTLLFLTTPHRSQMCSFLGLVRVLLLSLLVSTVVANNYGCGKPEARREWRKLSERERGDWISAVNVPISLLPHLQGADW